MEQGMLGDLFICDMCVWRGKVLESSCTESMVQESQEGKQFMFVSFAPDAWLQLSTNDLSASLATTFKALLLNRLLTLVIIPLRLVRSWFASLLKQGSLKG